MLAWLSENEPYSVNQLAEQLMLRQPSVTKLIDNAAADGLVLKAPDPQDARKVQVRLSRKGLKLATALKEQARLAENELIEALGQDQANEAKRVLRNLIRHAEKERADI